ncbi:MAG TPA: hypothetical protein VGX21_11030 [Methylomirabilota bacterium]|jgi:hypothetical protein|nr:hypothetical protein [Methylomirabilota bacterium]
MAEDSTRRLLKVFGVAVTDCEDALAALIAALRDSPGTDPAGALAAYGRASRELSQRWAELSRLILDYQSRAHDAIEAHLRPRSGT